MKKAIYIILTLVALIFVTLLAIPLLFKDQIKAKIDQEIAKNVDADVYFDADNFSLSLLSNFPNMAVSLKEFGIVGHGVFKADTLASMKEFKIVIDLMSLIGGSKMTINSIAFDQPKVKVIKLKDGKANYDIYKGVSDTTAPQPEEKDTSPFKLSVKKWQIVNGFIIYDDRSLPVFAEIANLNHTGSGDFSADVLDLSTQTNIDALTVKYDTVTYLNKNKMDVTLVMNMDMPNSKYTFKDNTIKVNDFAFGFDGFVQLNKDNSVGMDLTYKVKETAFKNILSLVPGIYTESFKDLKSEGSLAFNGFAKGVYDSTHLPSFNCTLNVKDGMFQYPKLPTPVKNVNIDLNVENKDGVIDNTIVNLKKFHLDIGSNPMDAKLLLKGLKVYDIDAELKTRLDLGELTSIFPLDSLTLKGIFSIDAKAKGVYKSAELLPTLAVKMNMQNGYLKTEKMPQAPLEQINFSSSVTNATGLMPDMLVLVDNFSMILAGEKFTANAKVQNFNDYTYTASVKGTLDMEKLTKIYPLKDMTLAGKIIADITTSGKMSLIKASKYDQLTTSGSMQFRNFYYTSPLMPQGFKMTNASMLFDPQKITIPSMAGFIGKSDFQASGSFSNYMAYVFQNQTLKGNVNFTSNTFDVNEWIPATDTTKAKPKDAANEKPAEIPKNLDFTMVADMKKVLYDKMVMTNMNGIIVVKDGIFRLNKGNFDLLDGHFITNCMYDSRDLKNPEFDYDLDIKNMDIKKAYETFNTIQKMAPVAKNMEGKFSSRFSIKSVLTQAMQPVYPTLYGKGVVNINDAKLKDMGFLNKVNSLAKLSSKDMSEVKIQNTTVHFEIKEGKVFFEPFDLNAGDYKTNIGGNYGLDNNVDYLVKSDVPAGALGNMAGSALAKLTGQNVDMSRVKVTMKVTGPSTSPKVSIVSVNSGDGGTTPKQAAKAAVQDAANKVKEEAQRRAAEEAKRFEQEALKRIKEEAAKKGQQEAAKKIEEEAKKLKGKLKFP